MQTYSITKNDGFARSDFAWSVWHQPSITRLSDHATERDAKAAVRNYEAADARRAKQS